ncbi:MAG: DUF2789 domain-containing protein [Pseudomonas sp.]
MDTSEHNLSSLFKQLGLPAGKADIDAFIGSHRLSDGLALAEAPFWNKAQAGFLAQALNDDSDWAEAADELAVRLSR